MDLINWIQQEIATNQFFSAALGGSVFYSVFGYVRSVASSLWHKFANLFIREITVSSYNSSEVYDQLIDFVSSKIKHPKNIQIKQAIGGDANIYDAGDDEEQGKQLKTAISYGSHWFWYNWYTYVYLFIKTEEHHAETKSDIINIRIYSPFSRTLREEISKLFIKNYTASTSVSTCYEITQYGVAKMDTNKRKLESVFINKEAKEKIQSSILSLVDKADVYNRAGINRTIGVMLYGPPGTGKTSYIAGLAKELNRSIYYMDFSTFVDQKSNYLRRIKPNSFLVLEDIDTIPSFRVRDDKAPDQKDLGKLLKILDGAQLPDNTVIFATTNYIDRIDPAVKRFGRFDLHFEFQYADKDLATEMVNYIDPSKIDIIDTLTFPMSQAEIQARVLKSVMGSEYKGPSLAIIEENIEIDKDKDGDEEVNVEESKPMRWDVIAHSRMCRARRAVVSARRARRGTK